MQRQNFAGLIRVSGVLCLSLLGVMLGGLAKLEAVVQPVSFGPKTDFGTGMSPASVAVGDFDSDGRLDLAVANQFGNTVSIRLGTGTGSFGAKTDFATGGDPISVAVGDFNSDARLDLAVAIYGGSVVVLLGTGTGSFGAYTNFGTGSSLEATVAVGDFNGDNKLDLAVTNYFTNTVSILLGTGTGSFAPKTDFGTGPQPVSVAVGDFNGDGKLDLAVTNLVNANQIAGSVSILLGTGTGSFGAKHDFGTGITPHSVAVGEFNGDGKLDLAVANNVSWTVSILLGTGTGSFGLKNDFGAGSFPFSVAAGDFNGDGKLDLAVASQFTDTIPILLGTGTGSFEAADADFGTGRNPVSVAVGDFNGDGKLDLAVANYGSNTVSILLNTTSVGSCQLPVIRLSQGDPQWANEFYDHSTTLRIRQKGCALTSLCMALNFAGMSTDPGSLNQLMNSHPADYNGLGVNWEPATRDASGSAHLKFHQARLRGQSAMQYLDAQVCQQGHPVIVGVELNASGEPGHFVVVTGKSGADFQIADPGDSSRTTLSYYGNQFETRGFVADSPGDISSLSVGINDAADFLVIDPAGHRNGIDPATGQIVEEISNSAYFRDGLIDDLTGDSATEVARTGIIGQPVSGTYQLSVIGTKLGTYTLSVRGFSQDGSPQPAVIVSGMTRPGLTSTYLIAYSSTPGAVARVFDTSLLDDSNSLIFNFNSTSGDYQFTRCSDGFNLNGRSQVIKRGCGIFLQDFSAPDRRVVAQIDNCQNKGTATVQVFALGRTFTIVDRNTTNNTGTCQ